MSSLAVTLVRQIADDPEALAILAGLLAEQIQQTEPEAQDTGWMDTGKAAAYLGITPNALHKLTAARAIRFEQEVARGKCWFRREDLDDYRRGRLRLA